MKKLPITVILLAMVLCVSTALAFELGFNFSFSGRNGIKWVNLLPFLSGWTPPNKTFENTTTGRVKRQSFTITNSGNTYAEDVAVSVTGSAPFTLYSTQTFGNISAGRTLTAKVRFAPAVQGTYSGHITYSAPNIAAVSAALTGAGVTPSGGSCSSGTITTENTTNSPTNASTAIDSATNAVGQSFTPASSGTLYSVTFPTGGTPTTAGTVICRVGTSSNLATYLDESSVTISGPGSHEVLFSGHPALTSGSVYYLGCRLGTASAVNVLQATNNPYAGGTRFGGSSGWSMSARPADDWVFGVKLCN